MVERYSACQMTKASDKLPAIAGLAQQWPRALTYFEQSTKKSSTVHGAYYSGVFNDDVHNSLLWLRKKGNLKPRADRAPSWSWASVDGEVTFTHECNPPGAELCPDAAILSFDCGCGRAGTRHFICAECVVRLEAVSLHGIEPDSLTKSSRVSFTPARGPRTLTTLMKASRTVGWAVYDRDIAEDKEAHVHFVRISAVHVEGTLKGHCVLAVEPSRRKDGTQVRVGMGYIWASDLFASQSRQTISII